MNQASSRSLSGRQTPCERCSRTRAPQEVVEPGSGRVFPLHRLQFEAVGPGQQGPPDQLVQRDDDQHQRADPPEDGAGVALIGGFLQVGPQAGEAEVPLSHGENLRGHQEEPAPGPTHHAVPEKTDGRKGKFQYLEAEPAVEAEDGAGLPQFLRDGGQGLVPGEGHIPGLAGEDEDDGGQFGRGPFRQDGAQAQEDHWQEGEDGHALEDVQQGHQDLLGAAVVGRQAAIDQGEGQGEEVRGGHATDRAERVVGQRAGAEGDGGPFHRLRGAQGQPYPRVDQDGDADQDHDVAHREATPEGLFGPENQSPPGDDLFFRSGPRAYEGISQRQTLPPCSRVTAQSPPARALRPGSNA